MYSGARGWLDSVWVGLWADWSVDVWVGLWGYTLSYAWRISGGARTSWFLSRTVCASFKSRSGVLLTDN